ncbi:MAG: hypothetical protein PUB14_01865 [Lachnospiraceae bacterium]|nr:hypothetical protein [Lachnospiraceae bacterium]
MSYYYRHYTNLSITGPFFLVVLAGMFIVLTIIALIARHKGKAEYERTRRNSHTRQITRKQLNRANTRIFLDRFYELVFSSTSVLLMMFTYICIRNMIYEGQIKEPFATIWNDWENFFLLFLILFSVFITIFFDHVIVKIRSLTPDSMANIRLSSSVYILILLVAIYIGYGEHAYMNLIFMMSAMVAGRFVYFDFTIKDFKRLCAGVGESMPFIGLLLAYSGLLSFYGFQTKVLISAYGIIISLFIEHLFMCIGIILIERTPLHRLFC